MASTEPEARPLAEPARLPGGSRPAVGWRILAYLALTAGLIAVGRYAVSLLPREPLGWAPLVVDTAATVGAAWIVLSRMDRRSPRALGFGWTRAVVPEALGGLGAGVVLNGVAALLLFASGTAHFVPDTGTLPGYFLSLAWTLAYFGLAAAYEEALFRGYVFQALAEWRGPVLATVLMSALFALAHTGNPGIGAESLVNIFLAGVMLSVAYLRTRSLWFATALHAGWNWAMASLFGFPVSGLTFVDTPLYDAVETGADWWTGGAFGPEAGIAGTLAVALGIGWGLRSRALRASREMREARPLVDARMGEGA